MICLDVLRALTREPECREALSAEIGAPVELPDEAGARRAVERWAILLQAALLERAGREKAAHAFRTVRAAGSHTFGSMEVM